MAERKSAAVECIRPAGDRAFLITLGDPVRVATALRAERISGVQDVLPAAETVLVTLRAPADAEPVRRALGTLLEDLAQETDSGDVSRGTLSRNGSAEHVVTVPVRYDGADLGDVAELLGMTTDAVIAAHTGTEWRCAFVGFAPGFGYLESPDGRLAVPRHPVSRTAIPAGAVALAGGFSAVYPRVSPGGWRLIGHTDLTMWDADRDPPALIRAGATVRFEVAR